MPPEGFSAWESLSDEPGIATHPGALDFEVWVSTPTPQDVENVTMRSGMGLREDVENPLLLPLACYPDVDQGGGPPVIHQGCTYLMGTGCLHVPVSGGY